MTLEEFKKIAKTELYDKHTQSEPDWKRMAVERQYIIAILFWGIWLIMMLTMPGDCISFMSVVVFGWYAFRATLRIWMDKHNFVEVYKAKKQ